MREAKDNLGNWLIINIGAKVIDLPHRSFLPLNESHFISLTCEDYYLYGETMPNWKTYSMHRS